MAILSLRCYCSHSLVKTPIVNLLTIHLYIQRILWLKFSPLCLRAGRTHQLRVHCSSIGHPIVGDFTYSLGVDDAPYRMMLHAYLLHIPLDPQPLLVYAGDPFLSTVDPKWVSQRSLRPLTATVETLLEHRVEESRRIKEEESERMRKEEERRKHKKEQKIEESEEQRRQCQEWLSEWARDWTRL